MTSKKSSQPKKRIGINKRRIIQIINYQVELDNYQQVHLNNRLIIHSYKS